MKPVPSELSRLVAAAVVNRRFRKLLLTQPAKALEHGYHGERFRLTPAERQLVFSILAKPPNSKAKTLEEFALQLAQLTGRLDASPDESHKI